MAEMVSSAVVGETVNQILSGLIDRHEERPEQTEQMERLEMAHIKLEAALETSGKWQINDASLLRWRHKLKRAAQECDVALRKCKQRAVEDEEEEEARSSSFPRRLAHATKSLVAGFFRRDTDGGAAVRRFEWFADGANEFLRFVELGGTRTPRGYMFFDPLIGRLLAGQELRYRLVRGSQYHLFCVRPISFEDRGVEAKMLFVYEDDEAPEKNLCLGSILRLSESTDVVGITIKCLQLVTPHFRSTAESARKELAGLPTQDFSWVPYLDSSHKDHWNSIHSSLTQWFRPNPLCCKRHDELQPCSSSGTTRTTRLSDVSLEPVIEVFLQRHIPLSEYNVHRSKSTVQGERGCLKDVPHLKLGLLFSPHGSSEDLVPAVESSAIEVIDGEEQSGTHTNISLEQLDEVMLPKAIDCLYKRPEATAYQMFWKSKHGTAFLQVEKTSLVKIPRTKIGEAGARRLAIQRRRDPKLERWIQVVIDFLNLWVAHSPPKLQSSFIEWIHKANEMKQAPQQRPITS